VRMMVRVPSDRIPPFAPAPSAHNTAS
jgi:hypothetical protein